LHSLGPGALGYSVMLLTMRNARYRGHAVSEKDSYMLDDHQIGCELTGAPDPAAVALIPERETHGLVKAHQLAFRARLHEQWITWSGRDRHQAVLQRIARGMPPPMTHAAVSGVPGFVRAQQSVRTSVPASNHLDAC
jgi:hypothetical protein